MPSVSAEKLKGETEELRKKVKLFKWLAISGGIAILVFIIILIVNRDDKSLSSLQTYNSIEIVYQTQPLGDSACIIITHKKIYLRNAVIKESYENDTVPQPGWKAEKAYSEDGHTENVTVPKDYEFFVTIK